MADSTITETALAGWFPSGTDNLPSWRLDIVSLLAVVGESSMAEHTQPLTASWLACLPRIIPAPQVLLKPTRPTRMPSVNAIIVGVQSGILFQALNFFPNLLHPIDEMKAFEFYHYMIKHRKSREESEQPPTGSQGTADDKQPGTQADPQTDPEIGPPDRSLTSISTRFRGNKRPQIPVKTFSPLNILSVFSFVITWTLFGISVWQQDGVACVALFVISLASMVVGYASKWSPVLQKVTAQIPNLPPGNVVIRTREGAFIVVECNEEVARELYSGTEECKYEVEGKNAYRALVGLGTVLVMFSVVLLGNCNFLQQGTIGGSYIMLNGLYWGVSMCDKRRFWDLSLYDVTRVDDKEGVVDIDPDSYHTETTPSYTRTMWKAIWATKQVGWVKKSGAAPNTPQWDEWLKLAEQAVKEGKAGWFAVREKDKLVGNSEKGTADDLVRAGTEGEIKHVKINFPGAQQAPALEVQVPLKT